jgi:rod shape-determining protein MreC
MNNRKKYTIPTKYLVFILIFVCAAMLLLSAVRPAIFSPVKNTVSTIVIPLEEGINDIGSWMNSRKNAFKKIKELEAENKKLQEQVDELTEENSLLAQNKYELERLQDLYDLDDSYSEYDKIAARVVGKESGNWFNMFTINKGTKDGVEEGMNVISGGGLVGIVTESYNNYATVRSIIDDESAVSAKFADSSDIGIVSGDLESYEDGVLMISDVVADADVSEGDMVLTSHISSSFLPGILIGYVSEISPDSNNLTQSGYIIPVVDFEHLEEVLVIKELKSDYNTESEE